MLATRFAYLPVFRAGATTGIVLVHSERAHAPKAIAWGEIVRIVVDGQSISIDRIRDERPTFRDKVRLVKTTRAITGVPRIQLIEAIGRCLPEHSGSAWGYMEKLRILEDPSGGRVC